MTAKNEPAAVLAPLPKADGSATYSYAGYTVTASVNGPIEAPRADKAPYEALVDVIVRPAAGVGGTRERHLESILQSTLTDIILVKNFPRSLIQVVLQVTATPENEYTNTKIVQANLNLPIIPALLQTAMLALLSAAVPLKATATATAVSVILENGKKTLVVDPSLRDAEVAKSTHVLAFTSHNELLLAESEGDFSPGDWDLVYEKAYGTCCRPGNQAASDEMEDDETQGPDMRHFLRSTVEAKIATDLQWKN